jgi:Zn-dependent peptidase ImmA (M78 family)
MTCRQINYEEEAGAFLDEYVHKTAKGIGPPVHIEQVVEVVSGFDVLYDNSELNDNESGRTDFCNKVITIRPDEVEVRRRFSLAHEAGHTRLHVSSVDFLTASIPGLCGDLSQPHLSRRDSGEWHEVEANKFAAAVLMPLRFLRPAFREAHERRQESTLTSTQLREIIIADLANQFGVSRDAMGYRLKNTRLLEELYAQRLF